MKVSQTTKKEPEGCERRSRTTPKSQETRARVIRGAIQVLEECGVADATTRRIAAAAGVQLAALHYHFESKESLLLAVLETLNGELASVAFGEVTPGMPLDACLETLIRASWRHVARTRRAQIAQIELTLYALRSGEFGWLAARQYQSYVEVYAAHLVGSIGRSGEEAAVLAAALARFVLCGIDGLILQSFSLRDEALERAGVDALVEASRHHLRTLLSAP